MPEPRRDGLRREGRIQQVDQAGAVVAQLRDERRSFLRMRPGVVRQAERAEHLGQPTMRAGAVLALAIGDQAGLGATRLLQGLLAAPELEAAPRHLGMQ
ncbi:MAG TPA: hypothetical protein VJ743_11200, partial [Albitalea sp.]|nr:hypothetical protein [Albitalea sp.]